MGGVAGKGATAVLRVSMERLPQFSQLQHHCPWRGQRPSLQSFPNNKTRRGWGVGGGLYFGESRVARCTMTPLPTA